MATIKNNWLRAGVLAILGLGMVYGAQSFTNKEEVKVEEKPLTVLDNQTWHYVSGSPTSASSYSSDPVAECGTGDEVICEIQAPVDPSDNTKPQMTTQVVNDINSALSGTPSTNATVQSFRLE